MKLSDLISIGSSCHKFFPSHFIQFLIQRYIFPFTKFYEIMRKFLYVPIALIFIGATLNSCELVTQLDSTRELSKTTSPDVALSASISDDYFDRMLDPFKSKTLNTYEVKFLSQEFKYSGSEIVSTTFKYSVTGSGQTPQLDSFFLEVPECAGSPISWTPTQSAKLEPGGIKWNSSVSSTGSQTYSITFSGKVDLGIIDATVTRGSQNDTKAIVGPCSGVYSISGNLFIDADGGGVKDGSESGLGGFIISLFNESGELVAEVPTEEDGSYVIKVLQGKYSVQSLDEILNANYTASTPISLDLEVAEDQIDIDFGYLIRSGKIIEEIENEVILVNTQPTDFWLDQLSRAGRRNYPSVAEMNALLTGIEGLLLPNPFQFGTNKIEGALAILRTKNPAKNETEESEFLRQLLTAELNIQSGRGALLVINGEPVVGPDGKFVLDDAFNKALLIYGEARACASSGNCPTGNGRLDNSSRTSASLMTGISDDTLLLVAFNGTGGIGRSR